MASNRKDIGFDFDPTPFMNGLKKIGSGIDSLTKHVDSGAKKMGNAFAWAVAKGQLMANALTGLAKGFVNVVKEQIPEIGQAFGIASNIIFKNLFWPLRQQIVPMLQNMLNWVRDNRGMFLKLGQTIVNLFRAASTVAKAFISAVSPLWESLKKLLGFGKGDWMDTINLALAKTSVVVQYIGILLKEPIAFVKKLVDAVSGSGLLKDVIGFATNLAKISWNAITSFFSGLSGWVSPAVKAFDGIVKAVDSIFKAVFGDNGNGLNDFFRFLGNASGWTVTTVLNLIAGTMQTIADAILNVKILWDQIFNGGKGVGEIGKDKLTEAFSKAMKAKNAAEVESIIDKIYSSLPSNAQDTFFAGLKSQGADFAKAFNAMHESKIAVKQSTGKNWLGQEETQSVTFVPAVKDGVIQGGKPVATDPKDVIIAHKGTVTVSKNANGQSGGVWTVNLNVTEGNALQAGKNFADGLQYQMRSLLAQEAMTGGR